MKPVILWVHRELTGVEGAVRSVVLGAIVLWTVLGNVVWDTVLRAIVWGTVL